MGFTIWRRKQGIEKDEQADCGHRCFYTDGRKRTAFCDQYCFGTIDDQKAFRDNNGKSMCLDADRFSSVEIGEEEKKKYFYKCSL